VHKGDVLFEIDPRPLNAVLHAGEGAVAQRRRNSPRARATSNATTPLPRSRRFAQSQLDAEIQAHRRRSQRASLKAAVETAQLNVGFTKVTSLIDASPRSRRPRSATSSDPPPC